MTIRQNIPPESNQIPNGYSGSDQPSDFILPPCGIEDVDSSMKRLFEEELGFVTLKTVQGANGPINIKKPTVIFATGERFAIVKKLRPIRDRNGALMLPLISIRRTNIDQSYQTMTSRGINQQTGELLIKRRLDPSDRDYQNLINKLGSKNLTNMPTTTRTTGEESNDLAIKQGMVLDPKIGNNVFEVIAIPQPQFYVAEYEIVFWTSFTEHMNYMIEVFLNSQLPQGKTFKLETDKGYWFIAELQEASTSKENFDDFTEQERIIQYSFTMKVPAFLMSGNHAGQPVICKRYITATQFSFDVISGDAFKEKNVIDTTNKFILTDLEAANKQTPTGQQNYVLQEKYVENGKSKTKYVKIIERNQRKGETVYTASDAETLLEFFAPIKRTF